MDKDDIEEIADNTIYNLETIMINNQMDDGDKYSLLFELITRLTDIKNDLD